MATGHGQRDGNLTRTCSQHELRALGRAAHITRTDIGHRIQAEFQHPLAVQAFQEMQCERIIGIDHGHTIVGQCGVNRTLGLRYAQQATHALQMRRRDVVDQGHVWARNRGEISNVARLACTHFVHRKTGIFGGIQHRQWQPDFVVAVARVGICAAQLIQDRQQQGLDRCLAVAAGHGQHLGAAFALCCRGKIGQCTLGIGHDDLRNVGIHWMGD